MTDYKALADRDQNNVDTIRRDVREMTECRDGITDAETWFFNCRTVLTELDEALDRIAELEGILDGGADRGDFLYEQHKDRQLEKDDEKT